MTIANREWQSAIALAACGAIGLLLVSRRLHRSIDRKQVAIEPTESNRWEWNLRSDSFVWNRATRSFAGNSEVLLDSVHPDDRAVVAAAMQQAKRSRPGDTIAQEFRVQQSDGSTLWLAATGRVLSGDRIAGTAIDITPYKQTAIELQQINSQLEAQLQLRTAQLEQANDLETRLKRISDKVRDSLDESQILQTVVQELGVGLGVRSCNAALYDLVDRTSTICYEYNSTLFPLKGHVAKMANFAEVYDRLLQGEYLQFCNFIANPMRGHVVMLACPIADDRGVLGDLWLINDKDYLFRDLELRLVQQVANQCAIAIRQARLYEAAQAEVRSLERINWLKDEFLSTVSYELCAPVANMKLSIRLLETAIDQTESTTKTRQYLQILNSECDREIRLINDLLELQRLDAGRRSLLLESIDLTSLLPQVVAAFQPRARSRQQHLHLELGSEALPAIVTDRVSFDRILNELLTNACKFSPPAAEIAVTVELTGDRVCFIVCNSGVEIPAAEMPRLFDKFYRVPQGDPWQQGGTGLGLALVKRLVDLLEGSIHVTSSSNQTCFIVQLPDLQARSLPADVATFS
ncbi:PAS domain-containing sensor histidine kinase [Leptolyngbya sp. FACHB-1515]|uniref:sensor histidine kinase n=1 Tax=Leptolyngbya sp. FACHB-1515 TaxID=2933931 RepID=UPI003298F810